MSVSFLSSILPSFCFLLNQMGQGCASARLRFSLTLKKQCFRFRDCLC